MLQGQTSTSMAGFCCLLRRGLSARAGLDARAQRLLFFLPSPEARRSVRVPLVALGASGRLVVCTDLQVHCLSPSGIVAVVGEIMAVVVCESTYSLSFPCCRQRSPCMPRLYS